MAHTLILIQATLASAILCAHVITKRIDVMHQTKFIKDSETTTFLGVSSLSDVLT